MKSRQVPFLTVRDIAAAVPGTVLREQATQGLSVRVGQRGASFFWRKRWATRTQEFRLGGWPQMTIASARAAAEAAESAVRRGDDPRLHGPRQNMTLGDLLELWITAKPTSARFRQGWSRQIRLHCPDLVDRQIAHIQHDDLSHCVERVRVTHPAAAQALATRLRSVFLFARNSELLAFSPAARLDRGRLAPRERTPSPAEVRHILTAAQDWPAHHRAFVNLVAVLGFRRAEAAALTQGDYDRDAQTVTVRSSVSKTGASVVSPVPASLAAELARLPKHDSGPLIANARGNHLSGHDFKTINARLRALFPSSPVKLHDHRRALATWCSAQGWPRETIDSQLNHSASATTSVVSSAYFRTSYLDQRRKMLDAWANAIAPECKEPCNELLKGETQSFENEQ